MCCLLCSAILKTEAQVDTSFWFAAPNPSIADPNTENLEIVLMVTTYEQVANIKVTQPDNQAFQTITAEIGANTTGKIDLTSQRRFVVNAFLNTPLNKGLHITSDVPVSIYYEIRHFVNPETFSLKGRNALGTHFFTPFQTTFRKDPANIQGFDVLTTSNIHVIATENNTLVTFEPTTELQETSREGTFTVKLNKGQTYSMQAKGFKTNNNLAGTEITSNKPIAVTVSDDSFYFLEHTGDQLLPVHLLGTRYAAIRGPELDEAPTDVPDFDKGPYERIYVVATQNNTKIYNTAKAEQAFELDAGETAFFELTDEVMMIEGNAPFYAWHFTGYLVEPTAALLPPLDCNGSKEVGLINTDDIGLYLFIITKKGNESSFGVDNGTDFINSNEFQSIPGSNEYVFAEYLLFSDRVPTNVPMRIKNSNGFFHMGVMQRSGLSTAYAYHTDFTLSPNLNFGRDTLFFCEGEKVQLDAGPQFKNYEWQDGSTSSKFEATEAGLYWVEVFNGECYFRDSVFLVKEENPIIFWEDELLFCSGRDTLITPGPNFESYLWQDDAVTSTYKVNEAGLYWVEVENTCGVTRDSILVSEDNSSLDFTTDTCLFDYAPQISLAPNSGATFQWRGQEIGKPLITDQSGIFTLTLQNSCALVEQETKVHLIDLNELDFINAVSANNDGINEVFELPEFLSQAGLSITNRWGDVVYQNINYKGNWPEPNTPAGTYFYQITHPCMPNPLIGWVKIIR